MKSKTLLLSGEGPSLSGRPNAVLFHAGRWFVIGKVIDTVHTLERRAQLLARNIVSTFFVLCVATGFSFVLYEVWGKGSGGISESFFFDRTPSLAVFSVSLIFLLAVIARFGRMKDEDLRIPRELNSLDTHPPPFTTWTEVQGYIAQAEDITPLISHESLVVLEDAFALASKLGHSQVTTAHVLASLLRVKDVRLVFIRLGTSYGEIQKRLASIFAGYEKGDTYVSHETERLALFAFEEAIKHDMRTVNPLMLLSALVREEHESSEVLYDLGIDAIMLQHTVQWILFDRATSKEYETWRAHALKKPKGAMNRSYTAVATPLLDTHSRDLTQSARAGGLAPTIDREREFSDIMRIFQSGKRGVLLIGYPGVGKRSIVEGIAARMASEEVPEILQDKRFVELSVPSLVGGAGRQGQLEELILVMMNEIGRSGNIVLFIENIENLIGLSTQGAQNLDATDMIMQSMEQYGLPVIATTAPNAFRASIEQSQLMGAFETIRINEVDTDGAIVIIEGKIGGIEYKHHVFFTYGAIAKAVELSNRYLHEQYLPEKALQLLEEVASYVHSTKGAQSFVMAEDVAVIVSERTNIPVTQVTEKESTKLLHLEEEMHKRMIGQDEAVTLVAQALRRARAELRDQKRPIANFLFMGPTGVGKTELAKTVAAVYFGDEKNMVRLDMSEYQEQTSIYRLIGSPNGSSPGYLTEAVRQNPFSLLLLDELEKAHPDILNVFLQVMDDGRLTDGQGRTIDFTNAILIATSNAGSQYIQDAVQKQVPIEHIKEQLINTELKTYFRPEFLNRFDGIVVFKPLTFTEITQIVRLMLKDVERRLDQKGVALEATDGAVEELATKGFDPVFGARPLRRTIQEQVDSAIANALLQGRISRRDVIVLDKGGSITIRQGKTLE